MLTIVCYEDLWVNKVSISFLQQLDLKKNQNKTKVHLYRFGISGLVLIYFLLIELTLPVSM